MSLFLRFVLPLAGILLSLSAFGQTAVLQGKITDRENGESLPGASISLGVTGTVSDYDGTFKISVNPGTYQLNVSFIGYQSVNQNITLEAGESRTIDFQLEVETSILKTATVTSGKFARPISEETVSMEVLKPSLINNTGKVSLDKALEKIPGVTIIDGQANIRGGSGYSQGAGSRVLLLVDDIPILQADAGFPNWNDVPVENIEQIEVLKGAASALYGSSALNGIINVRTAFPRSKPETNVAVWAGTVFAPKEKSLKWWGVDSLPNPNTIGANFAHRQKFGKFDLVLGGFYQDETSFNKNTYNKYGRFNFSTRYRITDRLSAGINGNFNRGNSGSFFYWKSLENRFEGAPNTISTRDRFRYNIDPYLTYFDKGGNRHRILSRYFAVNNDNFVDNGTEVTNQSNRSYVLYGEYQFQRRFQELNMVLTSGFVGTWNSVTAELYGDTTFTSRNLAGYLQLDKKFGTRLNASAGFRYENNVLFNPGFTYLLGTVPPSEEEESKPVLRVGLNYQATPNTFLRTSWGQGYRYPTVAERYIFTNAGFFVLPNPFSTSETGWSAEVGIKRGFKISSFEGFLDIAAFYSKFQDMLEFNLIGFGFSSINIGDTDLKGIEISIAGRGNFFGVPTSILTGYTWIDPRFLSWDPRPIEPGQQATQGQTNYNNSSNKEQNLLKYRSRRTFKLDIETEVKNFNFGLETFYASHIEAIDFIFAAIVSGLGAYRENDTNGYLVNNLRSSYRFSEAVKLSILFNNVFNEDYSVRPGLMDAPRNLTARMDFKF
jgi:outer membrane receptor protein involved in Fe transport